MTQKPVVTSLIHKISKSEGRLTIKISSTGLRYEPTLIGAVLQKSDSQSAMPILKSTRNLATSRYQASYFMK